MALKHNDLVPGQRISVDHYQLSQPGRLYTPRGSQQLSKSTKTNMYQGDAIYVDHASKFISIQHQTSLSAADTVKGKLTFERDAYTVLGVILQQFHTDNGVFTSKEFMADLMGSEQSVRFSGVGAAHQNGSAERNIQTIVNMARTMMLHAALCSPSGFISANLWPMAMDHDVWLYNRIPSLIGLLLDRTIGSITAQFHLVFDDSFSTVHSGEDTVPDTWNHLITCPRARIHADLDDDDYSDLPDERLTPDERIARDTERCRQSILHHCAQLQNPETAVEREQRGEQLQQATIERENALCSLRGFY